MKNKILIFVAGTIFGAALFAGGNALLAPPPPPDQSTAIKSAQKVLADEKSRAARLDQRENLLKQEEAQLASSMTQNTGDAASAPDAPGKNPGAAIAQMTKTVIKQQMDMRMNALKSRLALSDDQTKAIQDIMDKQSQQAQDMTEKMLSGKMSKDDLQKAMKDQNGGGDDMDTQMKDILSPDQFTQYVAYQNTEKKNQAEAAANAELMQIQSSLNLSDDQKDKVFTAIYGQYAQQMGVDGAKPDPATATDINAQMEAKKAALQSVLTPEQMTGYNKFVDSQKEMINALTGGASQDGGDGNSTSTGTATVTAPTP